MTTVERDYDAEMRLPVGKTCGDCASYKRTCEWLISCEATNTSCDWAPSRFRERLDRAETKGQQP